MSRTSPPSGTVSKNLSISTNDTLDLTTTPISAKKWWEEDDYEEEEGEGVKDVNVDKVYSKEKEGSSSIAEEGEEGSSSEEEGSTTVVEGNCPVNQGNEFAIISQVDTNIEKGRNVKTPDKTIELDSNGEEGGSIKGSKTKVKQKKGKISNENRRLKGTVQKKCKTCKGGGCCYICQSQPCDNMIRCSLRSCKGPWVHYTCINMTAEESGEYKKYYCPTCLSEDPKRKNIKYQNPAPKKHPGEKSTLDPEKSLHNLEKEPNPEIMENTTGSSNVSSDKEPKSPGKQPEISAKGPEHLAKIPENPEKELEKPVERPESPAKGPKNPEKTQVNPDNESRPTDPQPKTPPTFEKSTQLTSDLEFNNPMLSRLVSDFSKELTKAIQDNIHLKSIIHNLETEISQQKRAHSDRNELERENLLLKSSNQEKDTLIQDMERKLEETVDALQLTKDQLDVATLDLHDDNPNSMLNKKQQIIDTKEKHLREKTSLLNKYRDALEKSRKENDQLKKEVGHLSNININNKLLHTAINENCHLIAELDIERTKVLQLNEQRKTDATKIKELSNINQRLKQRNSDDDYETVTDDSSNEETDKDNKNPPDKNKDKKESPKRPQNPDSTRPQNNHLPSDRHYRQNNNYPPPGRYSGHPPSVCRFFLENRCRYGTSCWRDHPMDQKKPNLENYNQRQQRYRNQPPNQNFHQRGQTNRNFSQNQQNYPQMNKETRSTSISNYSSIPKETSPNPQMQPQKLSPTNSPAQGQGNLTSQMPAINNQQQMLQKLSQTMLLNQIPVQMFAHQTPFQMLNPQVPVQMMNQLPNHIIVNPALNPDILKQLQNPEIQSHLNLNPGNTTLQNPCQNKPVVPEVNILENGDFPTLSPENYYTTH